MTSSARARTRSPYLLDKVVELEGTAGCRDHAMTGFEGGLRKCPTQTPRTTGNEPDFRLTHAHTSIVADGLCHSLP